MKQKIAFIMIVSFYLIFLMAADKKDKTLSDLNEREKCLALYNRIVMAVNDRNGEYVVGNILDGKGRLKYSIVSVEFMIDEDSKKEDKNRFEKVMKKNFPNYDLLLKNMDKMKISKKSYIDAEVTIIKNGKGSEKDEELGKGKCINWIVNIPGMSQKKRSIFRRLTFVKFKDKYYWVPFGW